MWSILYQCASEKFPYTFLIIELCLFAPYSKEIVEQFFNFRKVKKSDWCSKLKKENMETLLCIKLEGPAIKQFIKEHSSDAAAYQCEAKEQRKGGNRQPKKYKKRFQVYKQIH